MDRDHSETNKPSTLSWHTIHVASGSEAKVSSDIKIQMQKIGRLDALGDISVPSQKIWSVHRKEVNEVLYPGYVFAELAMDEDVASAVQRIPKVLRILGADKNSDKIASLSKEEVHVIKGEGASFESRNRAFFQIGNSVRIIEGAFEGMVGQVDCVDCQKLRLTVSVSIFDRPTPVDLDFSQVEKVIN